MLQAIKSIHQIGILHRDIKPGNFCISKQIENSTCHLIDFGLSRRFLEPNGTIRKPRFNVGFRGTARYASIKAHEGMELGRVDDLWSFFYMLIEFQTGTLPWKGKDKEMIATLKKQFHTPLLVQDLPIQMLYLFHYLSELEYESKPNYVYIDSLFQDILQECNVPMDIGYDWETNKISLNTNEIPRAAERYNPTETEKMIPKIIQREIPKISDQDPMNQDSQTIAQKDGFYQTIQEVFLL
jgi:tau tubulin kinase